ncbi:hypothetical protein RFI_10153 [Reticulomyxa filosa]|uniref:Uncharacterized protein n=1 Tax=Reticulomyxa filosa TaxID=46433 RepID=X6NL23_RETFI|nr:hypothetical protein RFI_10153 [Reticulomyxa filosa]|eukprot:ETO26980.1 hypothetical protein RFI_10153 [Reticulomyxa filosa]
MIYKRMTTEIRSILVYLRLLPTHQLVQSWESIVNEHNEISGPIPINPNPNPNPNLNPNPNSNLTPEQNVTKATAIATTATTTTAITSPNKSDSTILLTDNINSIIINGKKSKSGSDTSNHDSNTVVVGDVTQSHINSDTDDDFDLGEFDQENPHVYGHSYYSVLFSKQTNKQKKEEDKIMDKTKKAKNKIGDGNNSNGVATPEKEEERKTHKMEASKQDNALNGRSNGQESEQDKKAQKVRASENEMPVFALYPFIYNSDSKESIWNFDDGQIESYCFVPLSTKFGSIRTTVFFRKNIVEDFEFLIRHVVGKNLPLVHKDLTECLQPEHFFTREHGHEVAKSSLPNPLLHPSSGSTPSLASPLEQHRRQQQQQQQQQQHDARLSNDKSDATTIQYQPHANKSDTLSSFKSTALNAHRGGKGFTDSFPQTETERGRTNTRGEEEEEEEEKREDQKDTEEEREDSDDKDNYVTNKVTNGYHRPHNKGSPWSKPPISHDKTPPIQGILPGTPKSSPPLHLSSQPISCFVFVFFFFFFKINHRSKDHYHIRT